MKQKITNIIGMLEMGVKTEEQAISELLDLFSVSGSLLPNEDWISKNAPLNPDATDEDVLIHNWWIGGAKDYRNEILRRLGNDR